MAESLLPGPFLVTIRLGVVPERSRPGSLRPSPRSGMLFVPENVPGPSGSASAPFLFSSESCADKWAHAGASRTRFAEGRSASTHPHLPLRSA